MAVIDRQVIALMTAHSSQRAGILANLQRLIARLLRGLGADGPFDQEQAAVYAQRVAKATALAQKLEANSTVAYLRSVTTILDRDPGPVLVSWPAEPRGVDPEIVAARPLAVYRRARIEGLDELEAYSRAQLRADLIADGDVSLGMREGARQGIEKSTVITGYRRVIRPELSASGTCGLCAVASDRLYSKSELLPVHGRCKFDVLPVIGERFDPGRALNDADLKALYAAAGDPNKGTSSTDGSDLKRVRVTVVAHSELGPQLRVEGQRVRTAADAAADLNVA
jgi:hypothetical protein